MKMVDAEMLGLRPSTLANAEINVARLVVAEEFRHSDDYINYRESAIDRLTNMRVPYRSEHNILAHMWTRYFTVRCPYCHGEMHKRDSGSNGDGHWFKMRCECGAFFVVHMDSDAIGVTPPPND